MKISVIFRQKPEFVIPNTLFVILSVSEVSINKAYLKFFGFFATLKMTKRAQKPKNKAFKNFSVPKSASNEREREREVPRPNTAPFSLYLKALR